MILPTFPIDFFITVNCPCGRSYKLNWSFGHNVKCFCGQMYYADPAGRLISHDRIMYCYNAGKGFGDLVNGEPGVIRI